MERKTKLARVLFALCLALMSAGLFALTPLMAPVKPCSAGEFWADISEGEMWGGREMYPPRDGYFICYWQGFHGQFLSRVEEQDALAEFPRVIAKLDEQLGQQGPTTPVLQGYEAWLAEDAGKSDAHLLLQKVREAWLLYLRKNRLSSYRFWMEEERQFDRRWETVRRYWLNVLFEFIYLSGVITFAFWPWLRSQALPRKCAHVGLLPLLLMLPYHLGYATFTYTSAGPSGGVLYPWGIASLGRWSSLWPGLDMALPKPLASVSQPLGPMMSISGGGALGIVDCLFAGAVLALTAFSVCTLVKHLRRTKHPRASEDEGGPEHDADKQRGSTSWREYRRGVREISLAVLGAFLLALGLAFLGTLTKGPFITAAYSGHLRSLRWALMLRPGLISAREANGYGALHAAVAGYEDEVVAVLLEEGADPNTQAGDGRTPVHWAMEMGGTRTLEMLLSAGADANMRDSYGEAALHQALAGEDAALLIKHGAEVSAGTPDGRTPLHYAACANDPSLVETLLASGASLEAQDRWGQTPLHLAAGEGNPDVVKWLLTEGADPNAQRTDGRTPLHIAAERWGEEMVEVLLEGGAAVNARDGRDRTPLSFALERGHGEVAELLRQHGAVE